MSCVKPDFMQSEYRQLLLLFTGYAQSSFNLLTVLAGGLFSFFFFFTVRSGVVELLETKSRSTFLGESTHYKQRA